MNLEQEYLVVKKEFENKLLRLLDETGMSLIDYECNILKNDRNIIDIEENGIGRYSFLNIKKTAEYFNVSADYLLGLSDYKHRSPDYKRAVEILLYDELKRQREKKSHRGIIRSVQALIELWKVQK